MQQLLMCTATSKVKQFSAEKSTKFPHIPRRKNFLQGIRKPKNFQTVFKLYFPLVCLLDSGKKIKFFLEPGTVL